MGRASDYETGGELEGESRRAWLRGGEWGVGFSTKCQGLNWGSRG